MMTRWLRLASVLPSALALTPNDPAHHVKQVAIIGESITPERSITNADSEKVQVQVAHPLRTISRNMPPKQASPQTSPSSNATTTSAAAQRL